MITRTKVQMGNILQVDRNRFSLAFWNTSPPAFCSSVLQLSIWMRCFAKVTTGAITHHVWIESVATYKTTDMKLLCF